MAVTVTTILRALADLAPAPSERVLDVTRGGQPLVWLRDPAQAGRGRRRRTARRPGRAAPRRADPAPRLGSPRRLDHRGRGDPEGAPAPAQRAGPARTGPRWLPGRAGRRPRDHPAGRGPRARRRAGAGARARHLGVALRSRHPRLASRPSPRRPACRPPTPGPTTSRRPGCPRTGWSCTGAPCCSRRATSSPSGSATRCAPGPAGRASTTARWPTSTAPPARARRSPMWTIRRCRRCR